LNFSKITVGANLVDGVFMIRLQVVIRYFKDLLLGVHEAFKDDCHVMTLLGSTVIVSRDVFVVLSVKEF